MVAFSVALSIAAGPVGTAEPADARTAPAAKAGSRAAIAEPAIIRLRDAVAAAERHDPIPNPLQPALDGLRRDVADVGRCNYAGRQRRLCRRGFVNGRKTLVLLGDSHARHWIPALETITKRTRYAAYYLAKPGCTAARVTPDQGHGAFVGCVEWREWAIGEIRRLRPDVLMLTGAMPTGVVAPDGHRVTAPAAVADQMRAGLMSTIRAVRGRVGRLLVVSDAPGLARDPGVCLADAGADLGSCASRPSDAARLHFAADRAAARRTAATLIDARSWFCWNDVCPAVVGSTITYRDGGHLTTAYARSLGWPFQHAMRLARLSH